MTNLKVFENPAFGQVRTTLIDGEPWFAGKDVADALGYKNPQEAIRRHVDEEDRGVREMLTPSGKQELLIINESGLYSLMMTSKLPKAKEFKRWVTSEVLPSIRKTGQYRATPTPAQPDPIDRRLEAAHILATALEHNAEAVRRVLAPAFPELTNVPAAPQLEEKAQTAPPGFNRRFIARRMRELSMSCAKLGFLSHISENVIVGYLAGLSEPSYTVITRLASALEVPEGDLLTEA